MLGKRSKRIVLRDEKKLKLINNETQMLLQKYLIDMSLRELSPKTIGHYQYDLERWFIYILDNQSNVCVTELTDDDITEFLYFCKTEGNNVNRIRLLMSTLSSFYKFLRKKKLIKENPMEFMDRPRGGLPIVVQTFLTEEQVELLKQKLLEYGDIQLRAYILLSLSTMARVNAIANVRWEQIDYENRIIKDVLEKENKIVDLYFSEETKIALKRLKFMRDVSKRDDHGWLFRTSRCKPDKPIPVSTLQGWCHYAGTLIGIDTLHSHDLRHSASNIAYQRGMPLEYVSAILHHAGTDVTKRCYLKENTTQIIEFKDKYGI